MSSTRTVVSAVTETPSERFKRCIVELTNPDRVPNMNRIDRQLRRAAAMDHSSPPEEIEVVVRSDRIVPRQNRLTAGGLGDCGTLEFDADSSQQGGSIPQALAELIEEHRSYALSNDVLLERLEQISESLALLQEHQLSSIAAAAEHQQREGDISSLSPSPLSSLRLSDSSGRHRHQTESVCDPPDESTEAQECIPRKKQPDPPSTIAQTSVTTEDFIQAVEQLMKKASEKSEGWIGVPLKRPGSSQMNDDDSLHFISTPTAALRERRRTDPPELLNRSLKLEQLSYYYPEDPPARASSAPVAHVGQPTYPMQEAKKKSGNVGEIYAARTHVESDESYFEDNQDDGNFFVDELKPGAIRMYPAGSRRPSTEDAHVDVFDYNHQASEQETEDRKPGALRIRGLGYRGRFTDDTNPDDNENGQDTEVSEDDSSVLSTRVVVPKTDAPATAIHPHRAGYNYGTDSDQLVVDPFHVSLPGRLSDAATAVSQEEALSDIFERRTPRSNIMGGSADIVTQLLTATNIDSDESNNVAGQQRRQMAPSTLEHADVAATQAQARSFHAKWNRIRSEIDRMNEEDSVLASIDAMKEELMIADNTSSHELQEANVFHSQGAEIDANQGLVQVQQPIGVSSQLSMTNQGLEIRPNLMYDDARDAFSENAVALRDNFPHLPSAELVVQEQEQDGESDTSSAIDIDQHQTIRRLREDVDMLQRHFEHSVRADVICVEQGSNTTNLSSAYTNDAIQEQGMPVNNNIASSANDDGNSASDNDFVGWMATAQAQQALSIGVAFGLGVWLGRAGSSKG